MKPFFIYLLLTLPTQEQETSPTSETFKQGVEILNILEVDLGRATVRAEALRRELEKLDHKSQSSLETIAFLFADAESLFQDGEFHDAALVFSEVVESPEAQGLPFYPQAVDFLARSLTAIGYHRTARVYYEKMLTVGNDEQRGSAMQALMATSQLLGERINVDIFDKQLKSIRKVTPSLSYQLAKMLIRIKQYDRAITIMTQIENIATWRQKTLYLHAVACTGLKQYAKALALFTEVVAKPPPEDDEAAGQIHELAHLQRGRLMQEMGDHMGAMDAYQNVSPESPNFSEAQFETVWTYIAASADAHDPETQRDRIHHAVESLDMFLQFEPDSPIKAEATLLRGNLLTQLRDFNAASESFQNMTKQYKELHDKVVAYVHGKQFNLQQLLRVEKMDEKISENNNIAHETLDHWAIAEDPSLLRAAHTISELATGHLWVSEMRGLARKVAATLAMRDLSIWSSKYRDTALEARTSEHEMINLRERIVDLDRLFSQNGLSESTTKALMEVIGRRKALEPAYMALSKTPEENESRVQELRSIAAHLLNEVDGLKVELDENIAMSESVKQYFITHEKTLSATERTQMRHVIESEYAVVESMVVERKKLAQMLNPDSGYLLLVGLEDSDDTRIRNAYNALLKEEERLLTQVKEHEQSKNLIGLRGRLNTLYVTHRKLENELKGLRAAIENKSNNIRAHLSRELEAMRITLGNQEQELSVLNADAKKVGNMVAQRAVDTVIHQLFDLVTRSDLGDVEVTWARKNEHTEEINEAVREERDTLEAMERDYRDILAE